MEKTKQKITFIHQNEALNIGHLIGSARLGIMDKNGNEICEGFVIRHNENLFLMRMSPNRKEWVARSSNNKSWRDLNWVRKLANKHLEIVGNIHFSAEIYERWKHCL